MDRRSVVEKFLTFLGFSRKEAPKTISQPEFEIDAALRASSELYSYLKSASGRYFLSSFFDIVIQEKRRLIETVDAYKNTFFHQMIVGTLVDDVLSVDPVTNNVVDIVTNNESLKPIIDDLQQRIDIDGLVSSIIEDVIAYGDYVVRVEHDGKKVVAVEDDVDQGRVLVVYKAGKPLFLVDVESKEEEKRLKEFTRFIHFAVYPRRVKIKLSSGMLARVAGGGEWSEYVRVGKPLFWGCWDLINSLYILTVFYPVFAVQKMNTLTVIGVRMHPEVPQARAWEIARKYQELLNVYTTVDQYGRVSLADVIDTVGKYKVIPVWGDEKGFMQLADPRLEESFALDILADLRRTLCSTLGIPYGFLFGSDENVPKIEALKSFSRYVKRIANIQRAIREGLTQLVMIECRLHGLYPSVQDIEVRFRNSIINVEHLDRLEFISGLLEVVNTAVESVVGMGERLEMKVDKERIAEFVNDYLAMIGLEGVLKKEEGVEAVGNEFEQLMGGIEWEEEIPEAEGVEVGGEGEV